MPRSPLATSCVAFLVGLCVAAPARLDAQDLPFGKVVNKLTVPFSGTVAGPTENIDVSGNIVVKSVYTLAVPAKGLSAVYRVDKGTVGVGETSGQTYAVKRSSKFKFIPPQFDSPTQVTFISPFLIFNPAEPRHTA